MLKDHKVEKASATCLLKDLCVCVSWLRVCASSGMGACGHVLMYKAIKVYNKHMKNSQRMHVIKYLLPRMYTWARQIFSFNPVLSVSSVDAA